MPQKILIFLSLGMQVEKPKSISLMLFYSSSKMFSSLMSLWVMHLLWQYLMPSNTYLKILLASSSSNLLFTFDFR